MSDDCLFCRIASGSIPAAFVAETENEIAFRDINPQAPTHILAVPRRHVPSLAVAEDAAMLGSLMSFAASVARAEGLDAGGYRVVVNTGDDGGQSVDHLHVHILGGRHMKWPPG